MVIFYEFMIASLVFLFLSCVAALIFKEVILAAIMGVGFLFMLAIGVVFEGLQEIKEEIKSNQKAK